MAVLNVGMLRGLRDLPRVACRESAIAPSQREARSETRYALLGVSFEQYIKTRQFARNLKFLFAQSF